MLAIGPPSLYLATLLAFKAPGGRVPPGTISVKFFREVRGWPGYTGVKKFAESFNPLSRVHQGLIKIQNTSRPPFPLPCLPFPLLSLFIPFLFYPSPPVSSHLFFPSLPSPFIPSFPSRPSLALVVEPLKSS